MYNSFVNPQLVVRLENKLSSNFVLEVSLAKDQEYGMIWLILGIFSYMVFRHT